MRKYSIRVALFIESVLAFYMKGTSFEGCKTANTIRNYYCTRIIFSTCHVVYSLLDLPIQLALFISWFIAMILGIRLGYSYKDMQNAILNGISNGLEAVLILVSVGALIGTWIAGGIVPTLIYYGLEFIHPSIFCLLR